MGRETDDVKEGGPAWAVRLTEVMTKLGVNPACQSCGQIKWSISDDPESTTTDALRIGARNTYIPAYVMACRHCGFIRLHSRIVIDAALKDAPDAD